MFLGYSFESRSNSRALGTAGSVGTMGLLLLLLCARSIIIMAKCEAIDMKMIFNYYANISHFHNKGFALSLVLKVGFFGNRKWPITVLLYN